MAGGAWRRGAARTRLLRVLLRDTTRALQDVQDILHYDPEIPNTVEDITNQCCRPTALVILGSSSSAKARLLNCILGRRLLPDSLPRGCRWIKIQYGISTQVRLTVSNSEFELVDELECNRKPWDTLPLQDLLRQDSDLCTTLEIDLNNSLLKDGLRIIIPPDISTDPGPYNYLSLKQTHIELYTKKSTILKKYVPVYLFALNKFGRNVFSDNITKVPTDYWYKGGSKLNENDYKDCDASVFSSENCLDLHQIKEIDMNSQVLFLLFANSQSERVISSDATESTELYNTEELPESDQNMSTLRGTQSPEQTKASNRRLQKEQIAFLNELLDQWELITNPPQKRDVRSQWFILDDIEIMKNVEKDTEHKKKKDTDHDRPVKTRSGLLNVVVKFATECSMNHLLDQCTRLSEIHVKLLQKFILASFDMARELQIVPKKIQYVASEEQQLFETLHKKFSEGDKKRELLEIMEEVLKEMRSEINNMDWSVDDLPCHQDKRYGIANSIFYSARSSPTISLSLLKNLEQTDSDGENVEEALSYESYNFDDYDIILSNDESLCTSDVYEEVRSKSATGEENTTNIRIENEMELSSLSILRTSISTASVCTNITSVSIKQASLDVQRTVLSKLSRNISLKLVKFLDCLKDTYFGTLQRCLESLESSCRQELGGRPASEAMRQLLSVARQVDLTPCASFSLFTELTDFLRRLFYRLRITGGDSEEGCCPLSPAWRRRAALQTAHSLSPNKLARIISVQILERLSLAHEKYQSALTSLETALASRLHHTEDIKLTIRKKYAPSFARLCLESTSMCDLLIHGTPELGREIGRGQYGVVYAIRDSWAGHSPAAVKTVLPADERHYHELAMEFFYTRSIPAHPRIVQLLGSLVRRNGPGPPAVWLVSQRCTRDLHTAVRAGLTASQRMTIAKDIVEGIRYLHSLGLVHRDIKLKNVLLDEQNRAALSDLGFCAAEALMSGSVVGTPVHMAPELLNGNYHSAVDVYAFGILFWYLCAGSIRLPAAFEAFQNKEQLWNKVKRGLRPERLPHFSDECWEIMESCWASEPSQRALLGDIQPKLEKILQNTLEEGNVVFDQVQSDDSLDMTGLDDGYRM